MKQFLRSFLLLLLTLVWGGSGFAQTTIWSEDWSTAKNGDKPSAVNTMYTQNGSGTKVYTGDNYSGGAKSPELLISSSSGSWTIKISDLKGCTSPFKLSYKSNKDLNVTANSGEVSMSGNTNSKSWEGTFNLSTSASLTIVIKNTNNSNARIDDIVLTGTSSTQDPTLTFSPTEVTYTKGQSEPFAQPTLTWTDENGKTVALSDLSYHQYYSSNESVAKVDYTSGEITEWGKPGTTTISAQAQDHKGKKLTAEYTLNYDAGYKANFSNTDVTVYQGQESSFSVPTISVTEGDGTEVSSDDYIVTYESSDKNVATVDEDGKVTFNALGTTSIKATVLLKDNTELSASYTINYVKDPTDKSSLTFSYSDKTVYVGKTNEFTEPTLTWIGKDGNEVALDKLYDIDYKSSNEKVATIDKTTGKVTFVGVGTTTISVDASDNDLYLQSASYTLTYKKQPTTLSFSQASITADLGTVPATPSYTIKSGETVIADGKMYFTISPEGIATIDESTGALTLLAAGKATVSAMYEGNDIYDASDVASYELTVVDPDAVVEPIVFDSANKAFKGIETSYNTSEKNTVFVADGGNEYPFSYTNCMYTNNNVIQMKKSQSGILTSQVFNDMPNGYKVNVYYGTYNNKTPLTIFSAERSDLKSLSINEEKYNENDTYTHGKGCFAEIVLPNNSSFAVESGGNAAYISKIEIIPLSSPVTLSDTDDNSAKITKKNGRTLNATLTRTLKSGIWNTFCVPFDVTVKGSALEGAKVKQVKEVVDNGTTVTFSFEDAATVEAGKAYLVMPTEAIVNPSFSGVTVKDVTPANCSGNSQYQFVGVYSPREVTTGEFGTIYGVNNNNKLAKIQGGTSIRGMRAYFVIPEGAAAKLAFNDGEATAIDAVDAAATQTAGRVYNLNGQYLGTSLDELPRGVYVVNGKKVMK